MKRASIIVFGVLALSWQLSLLRAQFTATRPHIVVTDAFAKPLVTRASPRSPAPGIYQTAPYSVLAIIPSQRVDDAFAVAPPTAATAPMPTVKPELRLIPKMN